MRRRRLVTLSVAPLLALTLAFGAQPASATKAPSSISGLTASPGKHPGEIVFRWKSSGSNTDQFLLQTQLTAFSRPARNPMVIPISAKSRSYTMSKTVAARAGAPLGSANYLYYRLTAVNRDGGNSVTRTTGSGSVLPRPAGTKRSGKGTDLRVATFNVRSVKKTKDKRNWLARADDVAAEIVSTRARLVMLQEVSPGRADGKGGSTETVGRQTTTLLKALGQKGGGSFRMVRTTSYLKSGGARGTQGGRIIYDSRYYRVLSKCPEKTGKKYYNSACSFALPILSSDGESKRRRGAIALMQYKKTGKKFWAVSVHLDERHSSSKKTGPRYNALRGSQAVYLTKTINRLNSKHYPVIVGGDLNTWQSDQTGYSGHDGFISAGYYDAAAALVRVNHKFNTSNGFDTTLYPSKAESGPHLDAILIKGGRGGADRWVNQFRNPNADRPSDHNIVWADIRI